MTNSQALSEAFETGMLESIAACKRLARTGLTVAAIREQVGHNPETIRRYIKWPECSACGTLLRKPVESGLCGFCEREAGLVAA